MTQATAWEPNTNSIPYQKEAEAIEQAFRMTDMCAKSFQRAARQLTNIRLVQAMRVTTCFLRLFHFSLQFGFVSAHFVELTGRAPRCVLLH